MINHIKSFISLLLLVATLTATAQNKPAEKIRTLIVFFDGLRPDYITPEHMPNLYAFSKEASYGKQHHSVFPTVTRVNASSYSTGTYPDTHGLMGNTIYFPQISKTKGLNTGEYEDLYKIDSATSGHLLTATSLGEALKKAGERMMVFSSGSTGQALMQNHKVSGGAIVNPGLILPESFKQTLLNAVGPIPAKGKPNAAQHKWVTDALIKFGLSEDGPLVSAMWYSDPDGAAHSDGIGSPAAMESIRIVDAEFGRIIKALKETHQDKKFNIIISADHGFITNVGITGVSEFLIQQGLKQDKESEDVVVIGGAIYVKDHDLVIIKKIVSALQAQEWVGALFTTGKNKGDTNGRVEGTLSFETIHWQHPDRAADILVDENWNDEKNSKGYAGKSFSLGVAGHGGLSPYEVHIALLASGPSFKKHFESELPTSNVDLAPTILSLYHIAIPATMKGRTMEELLVGNNKADKLKARKDVLTTSATYVGGTYTLRMERSILGKYQYVNFAQAVRTK